MTKFKQQNKIIMKYNTGFFEKMDNIPDDILNVIDNFGGGGLTKVGKYYVFNNKIQRNDKRYDILNNLFKHEKIIKNKCVITKLSEGSIYKRGVVIRDNCLIYKIASVFDNNHYYQWHYFKNGDTLYTKDKYYESNEHIMWKKK